MLPVIVGFSFAGFHIGVGDFSRNVEVEGGLDFYLLPRLMFVADFNVIHTNKIVDTLVGVMVEGGGSSVTIREVNTYSMTLTGGLRYDILKGKDFSLYTGAGFGYQSLQMDTSYYPALKDDITYYIGGGGEVRASRILERFMDAPPPISTRLMLYLNLYVYGLKIPTGYENISYEWDNRLDFKVGLRMLF